MTTPATPAADAVSLRFRKKPVVIEAVQFTQAVRDAYLFDGGLLPAGVQIFASNTHPGRREVYRADAYIETLEGRMAVTLDDWIITGVNGEHYPCKPDIFAKTYEPAEAAQSLAQQHALELLSLDGQAMDRESALVAERDALRAAMDHIAKTCLASRSQSRRIRWIEARARGALLGQNDLHRMIDLPKDGGPATAEKLQRRIVHERHMHNITNGLTAGILGAALAAPAVEG